MGRFGKSNSSHRANQFIRPLVVCCESHSDGSALCLSACRVLQAVRVCLGSSHHHYSTALGTDYRAGMPRGGETLEISRLSAFQNFFKKGLDKIFRVPKNALGRAPCIYKVGNRHTESGVSKTAQTPKGFVFCRQTEHGSRRFRASPVARRRGAPNAQRRALACVRSGRRRNACACA